MKISDNVLLAIITGLPATIASLATLVNSLKNTQRLQAQTEKINAIHESTNGMKDALVASTAKASHAEGMADQRAEDRQYNKPT